MASGQSITISLSLKSITNVQASCFSDQKNFRLGIYFLSRLFLFSNDSQPLLLSVLRSPLRFVFKLNPQIHLMHDKLASFIINANFGIRKRHLPVSQVPHHHRVNTRKRKTEKGFNLCVATASQQPSKFDSNMNDYLRSPLP